MYSLLLKELIFVFYLTENSSKIHIQNTDQSRNILHERLVSNKTLQFATLNVCGLKTRSKYPDFVDFCNKYDFLCFTETKIEETEVISIPEFISFSQSRRQKFARRSGGISVYVKQNIKHFMNIPSESDYVLWFSINKSLTNTEEDLIFGIVYIPPENSRFLINYELMTLEIEITETCSKYKCVVLTGDFNTRTSNLPDYMSPDTVLADFFDFDSQTERFFNPDSELTNYSVARDRKSKDTKTNNNHGYKKLDICKNNNLFLVNGRIDCDKAVGNYTFRNISVLDYCIVSLKMFEFYQDFEVVETDPLFSDGHCLLRSILQFDSLIPNEEKPQICTSKPKWKPEYKNDFIQHMDCIKINTLLQTLENTNINKDTINNVINQIGEIFENATRKTCPKPKRWNKPINKSDNKAWFGSHCKVARRKYHTAKKKYNKNKTGENKRLLNLLSKEYKRIMNRYINKYNHGKEQKLREMHSKSPKQYWQFFNNIKGKSNTKTPSVEVFYEYFEKLNQNDSSHSQDGLDDLDFQDEEDLLNSKLTESEILTAISMLKTENHQEKIVF